MTFKFSTLKDAKGFTDVFGDTVRHGKTVRFPSDGYDRMAKDIVVAIAGDYNGKLVRS